jgi:NADPH-dependent 2,4-dienoyl-CoA reductase/sulfur reductase-like enzyme
MAKEIVVIGGSIAGVYSAISAARFSQDCKVLVLSDEEPPLYRRPSIIDVIKGAGTYDTVKWFIKIPENVKIIHNVKVEAIDVDNKLVKVKAVKSTFEGQKFIKYDSLVIATGSVPMLPKIKGINLRGIHSLRTLEDAIKISNSIKAGETCVVVGGGFVGLLTADALLKRGVKPVLCEKARLLCRVVEPDVSEILKNEISKKCRIVYGNLEEIVGSTEVQYVKVDGEKIRTSTVILATGTRPSVELAKSAGVRVSEEGIQVDEKMATSIPDIYSAGDCNATLDFISKKHVYMPLASKAAIEGMIAGCNAAGGMLKSSGFIRSQYERVFDLDIITIGLTCEDARNANIKAEERGFKFPEEYRKGVMTVKMICNDEDELIGFQLVAHSSSYVQKFLLQNIKKAIYAKSMVWQKLMKFLLEINKINIKNKIILFDRR